MDVIPVIDVANGGVVHAVAGNRKSYAPLQTPLAADNAPVSVARGLATLFPFRKFYLADLDGIAGRGRNVHLVPEISRAFPHAELWVDAGSGSRAAARRILAAPVTTLVVGSESLESLNCYLDILKEAPARTVLSLDFRGDEFMGPQALLDDAQLWPDRVIVMTLQRIGSNEGPDLARIRDIAGRAKRRKVYAAGGIASLDDLRDVEKHGATGALMASALHGQKITASNLKEMASR